MSSALTDRLGYLLKHAQLDYSRAAERAFADLAITGRTGAVLAQIASDDQLSQQELAATLGVDRTTMVSMLDDLEIAGLVKRAAHPDDRRRNVVSLTTHGTAVLEDAEERRRRAEAEYLAPLSAREGAELRRLLAILVKRTD